MLSTFGGIDIGYSGLQANQQGLDVTGHNIANAGTEGYSRQQVIMKATTPLYGAAMNNPSGIGQFGTGVEVECIQRIRDAFIDQRLISENKSYGYWDKMEDLTHQLELIYNEPSSDGLSAQLDNFWSSLQNLANAEDSSEQSAAREIVVQNAITLTETVNSMYEQMQELGGQGGYAGNRNAVDHEIDVMVDTVNSYSAELAELNKAILSAQGAGKEPNDLLDRRDQLILELSKMANVSVTTSDPDDYKVTFCNLVIVQGVNNYDLQTKVDDNGKLQVFHQGNNLQLYPTDGELKALLDFRDKILPYNLESLNEFAINFTESFNEIHRNGFGLDGSTNVDFFEPIPENEKGGFFKIRANTNIEYADVPLNGLSDTNEPENFEKRLQRSSNSAVVAPPYPFLDVSKPFDPNMFLTGVDLNSHIKISVDGKEWTSDRLSAYSSVDEFMDKINNNNNELEGIYISYDEINDKFALTAVDGDFDVKIEQIDDNGNNVINGFWAAANISTTTDLSYSNVSDRANISGNSDGIVNGNDSRLSINGTTVFYDGNVDSLNDIINRINETKCGVTAALDPTGRLTLTANKDSDYKITSLQDNGNLLYSLGILSEGRGYFGSTADSVNIISENVIKEPVNDAAYLFKVSDALKNDPKKLASIGGEDKNLDNILDYSYGPGDNTNVYNLAALRDEATMGNKTISFNDYYQSIISKVGVEAKTAKTNASTSETMILNLTNLQQSVSGVSLDEEFANLIKFQNGYTASARFISTMSEMLEVLMSMGR